MMKKGDPNMGRSRTMKGNLNFNIADAFGMKDSSWYATWILLYSWMHDGRRKIIVKISYPRGYNLFCIGTLFTFSSYALIP